MVRFIMPVIVLPQDRPRIYIPIWLDLLSIKQQQKYKSFMDLHSNMVRFIIGSAEQGTPSLQAFTFQYG